MYTCDNCGQDVLTPENLAHCDIRDDSGSKFYTTENGERFDVCICFDCLDYHSDVFVLAADDAC